MSNKPPSIEITIENSVVGGDVVAGDKTVHVHLHADQLTSLAAVYAALGQQGHNAQASDFLIKEFLKHPELLARLDVARREHDREAVDKLLASLMMDVERTGVSPEMLAKLSSTMDAARRTADWVSFSKAGTALLGLTFSDIESGPRCISLADELVVLGRQDELLIRNIPIARICQARHLYFQYTNAILELSTALAYREHLPVKLPLINLVAEHKKAIGYLKLSDEYARQALDIAFERAQPNELIFVMFGLVSIQEHAHFHHRYSLRQDAGELGERVLRSCRVLEQMIDSFGSESDRAILHSNLANFWRQTNEFEKAEHLALSAAKKLAALGYANGARRAMDVAEKARQKEPVFRPPPTHLDIEELSLEQVTAMLKEASDRLIRLHGIDDPTLKGAIECAWKDFNPERVLLFCEHITADCQPTALASTFGVPTLGSKRLGCNKFQRSFEGATLDGTFEFLKQQLDCASCEHRVSRPKEWKWSLRWAREDAEKRSEPGG